MQQIKLDDILKRSPTDDELDQAIKVIKDVCRQYKNCVECPMNCNCNEHPAEWTETGGKT